MCLWANHVKPLASDLYRLEWQDADKVVQICQRVSLGLHMTGYWADEEEKYILVNTRGLIRLRNAIGRYLGDPEVVSACSEVVRVAVVGVAPHQHQARYDTVANAVIKGMRHNMGNATVMASAAHALCALCRDVHDNSRNLGLLGAAEILMQALQDHGDNPEALNGIWCGVTALTCHGIGENHEKLVELGLIEIGIRHMRRFRGDQRVRTMVQPALVGLVNEPRNDAYLQRLVDAGYLEEVVSALRDFPTDEFIVLKCFESIRDLSRGRPDVAAALRQRGVVEMLTRVLTESELTTEEGPELKEGWVHFTAVQAAGALAREERQSREAMLRAGLPKHLKPFLEKEDEATRHAACDVFRELAADGQEARQVLVEALVPESCLSK